MFPDIKGEMLRKLLDSIQKAILTSDKLREETRELDAAIKKDPENFSLQIKGIQGINFMEGYSKALHDVLVSYYEK